MSSMLDHQRRVCGVFAVGALLSMLSACSTMPGSTDLAELACDVETTSISAIQGRGNQSPLLGQQVHAEGIVTLKLADGFVLQQVLADTDPMTSDAMLVVDPTLQPQIKTGDALVLAGRVTEYTASEFPGGDTMTAFQELTGWASCGGGQQAPVTADVWPLDAERLEALEGMQLVLDQTLYASDVYRLEDGEFAVSRSPAVFTATETQPPGQQAGAVDRIAASSQFKLNWPDTSIPVIRAGDPVVAPQGVVLQLDGGYRLQLTQKAAIQSQPVPLPRDKGGALRIVSYNLLNYFNGDGQGGGFPTERGAETAEAFAQQRRKHRALFTELWPDILAVQELENDGFGPDSAAADLLEDLEMALPDSEWAWVEQPVIGSTETDSIRVGMAYRTDRVNTAGQAGTLGGPNFSGLSRVPLAQIFEDDSGYQWTLIVNHLKSKGGCPDEGEISRSPALEVESRLGDGQACWNAARTAAAEDLLIWIEEVWRDTDLPVLMVGDFNAYRQEDPIQTLKQGGLVELVETHNPPPQWSFIYRGARGTLDYAFATPNLAAIVERAFIWHANAADAPGMALEPAWRRASDHDPVVIDLTSP